MSCGCLWNVWLFSAKPCVDCRFDSCDSRYSHRYAGLQSLQKISEKKKTKQDIRNLLWTFSTSPLIFQMLTSCSDFFYRGLAVTSIHWHDAIIHYIVGNRNLTRKVAKTRWNDHIITHGHNLPWDPATLSDSTTPRAWWSVQSEWLPPGCRKEDGVLQLNRLKHGCDEMFQTK